MGKKGWIDTEKPATTKMCYVIVDLGQKEKKTRVRKESVRVEEDTKPSSYAQAALWQNPDIESKLDNLCQELAKCSIHQDANGIIAIIHSKLVEATTKQVSLGSKAAYRHVEFSGES
jgi:hypothetical protein